MFTKLAVWGYYTFVSFNSVKVEGSTFLSANKNKNILQVPIKKG